MTATTARTPGTEAPTVRRRAPARPAAARSALHEQQRAADDEQTDRHEHGLRRPRHQCDPRHERGPEHEDDLVEGGLHRERGLQAGRAGQCVRPPRAHERAGVREGRARQRAGDEQRPGRRVMRRQPGEGAGTACTPRPSAARRGLAVPVDERPKPAARPPPTSADTGRDRAGEPVATRATPAALQGRTHSKPTVNCARLDYKDLQG